MRRASQHMVSAGRPVHPGPPKGCKATTSARWCPLHCRSCQHLAPLTDLQEQGNKMVRRQPSSKTAGTREEESRALTPDKPPQMRVHGVRVDNATADLGLVAGRLL